MDCSYRVRIGSKTICFCDRVAEASELFAMFERGSTFPKAIYGPEGCGKTTLLRYLVHRVSEIGNVVAVYIDALKGDDPVEAIFSPLRAVYEVANALVSEFPIGRALVEKVLQLFKRLHERVSLKNRKILLVVDDVYRAIGLEGAERYTKNLYEWIKELYSNYGAESVLVLLATSEGISKRKLLLHSYVHVYAMWNLPRDGFEELMEQLEPSIDFDTIWMLTGGNPRALIDLYEHR